MSSLIVPEYNENINWETEWFAFMDIYKLWRVELFDNKQTAGKTVQLAIKESLLAHFTGNKLQQREITWQKYCHSCLCLNIRKKQQGAQKRSWQSEQCLYANSFLLTINLKSERNMTDIHEVASFICNEFKWIEYAEYVLEYHTDTGGHPHAHILCYSNNPRCNCKSNIKNMLIRNNKITNKTLRKLLDDNAPSINIVMGNKNSQNYIDGNKQEKKECNTEADRLLRENLGLEHKYIFKRV